MMNSTLDDPVMDQPSPTQPAAAAAVQEEAVIQEKVEGGDGEISEEKGVLPKSTSWYGGWGSYLTSAINDPHLLGQGIQSAVSQVTQATSGATKMVKSKSMEVMKAVSTDLGEVKETVSHYADPLKPIVGGATNTVKKALKEIDEATDEMADVAISGVAKGATNIWNMASGYASQMFVEEDLEATALLVGGTGEPIILDRLQAQLHALASDPETFLQDPHPSDQTPEEWTQWLADLDLDRRQGEISELMINNVNIRKHYSKLVPGEVSHKLFWARYFYKVHLIEKQEVKRQVLKKRAEQTKEESDGELNWDDDEDVVEIPEDVQDKLLKEYEKELKSNKSSPVKKGSHEKKDSSASDDWEKVSQ